MLVGEQAAQAPGEREASDDGYAGLGQGLMLLRASTMKMVRLQLAMERRDRRAAMETLDDLVVLDGRIRDLLTAFPPTIAEPSMQQQLDEERSALVRERLLLAAGANGPRLVHQDTGWVEPASTAEQDDRQGWDQADQVEEAASGAGRSSTLLLFAVLLLLASLVAGGAALFGTDPGRELLAPLLALAGAS